LRGISEALADASRGTKQIRGIVRDLKGLSRVDEDKIEPIDVRRPIESAINMAWNEIRHRARLTKDYVETPLTAANEAHLTQVFLNHQINAAQAIPSGHVEDNLIRVVSRTNSSGNVIIEIHDTGEGIPPEVCGHLFEPFFTTKATGAGTGLGLSISNTIVRHLGGEITVASEVGKGSTFRVRLPAALTTIPEVRPPEENATCESRARILVIDDEPMFGPSVQRMLGCKHEVSFVTSGQEAVERLTNGQHFDVILLDVMLPDVSASRLFGEIEQRAPQQIERIIFMTSGAFTTEAREFLERVPNTCLDKPLDAGSLHALVNDMCASK
jgi:CheY-like chemotaxis protein